MRAGGFFMGIWKCPIPSPMLQSHEIVVYRVVHRVSIRTLNISRLTSRIMNNLSRFSSSQSKSQQDSDMMVAET